MSHDRPDKNVLYVMFCPSLTCSNIAQHNSTGNRFEKLHRHIKKRQTNCLKRCSIPLFQTIEADVSHDRLDITCWPLLTCSGITWHNNTGNLMEKSHRHVQKHHINWWTSAAFPLFRVLTDVLIFEPISIDQLVAGATIPAINCELK